jgi:hypothetical protein
MNNQIAYLKANTNKALKLLFIIAMLLPLFANAQTKGTAVIVKDPLIDTVIARLPSLYKIIGNNADDGINGYRVQIFFGSNRQAAYNALAKFSAANQENKAYITYTEPNFKVRAGDFRTHLEAEKLLNELLPTFTSMFIIPEKINLPKTDQQND